ASGKISIFREALMKLRSFLFLVLLLGLLAACAPVTPVPAPTVAPAVAPERAAWFLPDGERWLTHFTNDLLPFWDRPEGLGDPIGRFPSKRCNDGALYAAKSNPCPEIGENGWLVLDLEYTVSRSRQTYAYGVAFHLTGEPRYLDYAKAGVDYLRQNAFDRKHGGVYALWNGGSRAWEPAPEFRNPQELAYSLLGISFYYYLTRDPEVLPDILAVKDFIFENYYNPDLNALQWMQASDGSATDPLDKRLVAQLDNLNAYMVLITPLLPEPEQSAWKADMVKLARLMIDEFYSEQDNLFFLTVNDPAQKRLENAGTDFGHSIKAMWMIYHTGLIADAPELVTFAQTHGPRILEQAYLAESGSWANGYAVGGVLIRDKDWWIYNELDQFAMVMALGDPSLARYLPQTTDYYFRYFVDPQHGEVWTTVDGDTNQPKEGALPKAWPWKNAYHTFEHALLGYITAQQMNDQPVTLYYAFQEKPAESAIQPYFLRGDLAALEPVAQDGVNVYQATFTNVR
ncbi:MAG: AGE family epimerase/isomerase, partial [Caldilinea sp.]